MANIFPGFTQSEVIVGDRIRAIHINNIEDFLANLVGVKLHTGQEITGVTTFHFGSGFYTSGTANTGVYISATGSVSGSGGSGALSFPAIYSNFYVGLIEEIMMTTAYEMSGIYIKTTNAPTGDIEIKTYINGVEVTTGTLTGTVLDVAYEDSLVKGDIIKFEVTEVNDATAGNPIFFGIY